MSGKDDNYERTDGLFRSRSGIFLGVCKGLAKWTQIPPVMVRLSFIILAMISQVFPVVLVYFLLAFVMRPEPVVSFRSEEEVEFFNTYGDSRMSAVKRMKTILTRLESRVQRLENAVTDPEKDWDRRFRNP